MRFRQQKRNAFEARPFHRLDLVVEMLVFPGRIPFVKVECDVLDHQGPGRVGRGDEFRAAVCERPVGEVEGVEFGVEVDSRWEESRPKRESIAFLR